MTPLDVPVCRICGERMEPQELAHGLDLCASCRLSPPRFERAVAYASYEGGVRELIQLLKYGGVRPAANVLGRMLADALASIPNCSADLLVPVPLHRGKRRQRGFNQSECIAQAATKCLRARGIDIAVGSDVLERVRETESQTGLTPAQREANVHAAFAVVHPERVKGRAVVVVDDVYTTGATVSECARVLRRAGVDRVLVATVARALKPEIAAPLERQQEDERVEVMA